MPWKFRLVVVVAAVVTFNVGLYGSAPSVFASIANRYALVRESSAVFYTAAKADIWTGAPSPVPAGTFSNQTIWAVNDTACSGAMSWIEAGWTKKGTASIQYKFIYKVPGTQNCTYQERLFSPGPEYNTSHNYRLEWCTSCGSLNAWYLYLDNAFLTGVVTGWHYANRIDAGGEVGGDYVGIGMQGGMNLLKYRLGNVSWYDFSPDSTSCDYGYTLIYNGSPHNIYDWGYQTPGSCP